MNPVPDMVIIADTQSLTALGVGAILCRHCPMAHTATAASRDELIGILKQNPSSVVILDYSLFDIPSADRLLIIAARFPRARWIMLSAEFRPWFIRRFLDEDSFRFLLKSEPEAELVNALGSERLYLSAGVKGIMQADAQTECERSSLTAAETDILRLIALGKSAREIAQTRNSSIHTIVTHKKNIFRKLQVSTAFEATRYATRAGIVQAAEYFI